MSKIRPDKRTLTIAGVAHAVGKDQNYVRQHVHRGHLKAATKIDGHRVVDIDEAKRWAHSRGLPFGETNRHNVTYCGHPWVTHAVIMPFPVANLMTWCGHRCDSPVVKNDFVVGSPDTQQAVTCQRSNLEKWIPKLL